MWWPDICEDQYITCSYSYYYMCGALDINMNECDNGKNWWLNPYYIARYV